MDVKEAKKFLIHIVVMINIAKADGQLLYSTDVSCLISYDGKCFSFLDVLCNLIDNYV